VVTGDALESLAESLVNNYCGLYQTNVDENTTHIISSQPSSSEDTQIRKAREYGVPVVKPHQLLEVLLDGDAKLDDKADYCSPAESPQNKRDKDKMVKHVRFQIPSPPTDSNQMISESVRPSSTAVKSKMQRQNTKALGSTLEAPQKHSFYIPMDPKGTYQAKLKKKNAFYCIEVVKHSNLSHFKTVIRWGRDERQVGCKLLGDGTLNDAKREFMKKFQDKTGLDWDSRGDKAIPKKYAFIEDNHTCNDEQEVGNKAPGKEAATEILLPESRLDKPIQELMQLIFDEKGFQEAKMALRYESDLTSLKYEDIRQGFEKLKKVAAQIQNRNENGKIPGIKCQVLPGEREVRIKDLDTFRREVKLLQGISNMKVAYDFREATMNSREENYLFDRQYQSLALQEMTPLRPETEEFKKIMKYLNYGKSLTRYVVKDIFRISRQEEYMSSYHVKDSRVISDRHLLWYGSRAINYSGILNRGIPIAPPEAPLDAFTFGRGIYLTDVASESAKHCSTASDALLLLCEANLGDPIQTLTEVTPEAGIDARLQGLLSTRVQGKKGPRKWIDAGCVHENLKGVQMVSSSPVAVRALQCCPLVSIAKLD
jgi:poly [ADP-ribose] polymerase